MKAIAEKRFWLEYRRIGVMLARNGMLMNEKNSA
jgi:hypothetical protein